MKGYLRHADLCVRLFSRAVRVFMGTDCLLHIKLSRHGECYDMNHCAILTVCDAERNDTIIGPLL